MVTHGDGQLASHTVPAPAAVFPSQCMPTPSFQWLTLKVILYSRSQLKNQKINSLDFMSHRVSTTMTQLCPRSAKAVIDNPQMTECGCVPVKPYKHRQQAWPTGRGFAIPALKLKSDHVSLLLKTLRQLATLPTAKDKALEEPARACSICSRPCLSLSLLLAPLRTGNWPPPYSSSFSSSEQHQALRPCSFCQEGTSQDAQAPRFLSVCLATASPGRFSRTFHVHRQALLPLLTTHPLPPLYFPPQPSSSHISHTCLSAYCLSPPTRT